MLIVFQLHLIWEKYKERKVMEFNLGYLAVIRTFSVNASGSLKHDFQ